jgi:hypothetical protein
VSGNRATNPARARGRNNARDVAARAFIICTAGFGGNEPLMRNASRFPDFFDVHFRILLCRALVVRFELRAVN